LLELDRGRVAPGSAGARRRCGRQAIEAALSGLGYQAAIIKVPSHSKTLKATKTAIEYLRHGCEEVENELGERRTIDEAKADVDERSVASGRTRLSYRGPQRQEGRQCDPVGETSPAARPLRKQSDRRRLCCPLGPCENCHCAES
ncbi:MAG: hypothetical protein MJE77_08515, partial [Proteobacteria bacterium]|nr:hypothetical protein [Pseudomonadota bacterium]